MSGPVACRKHRREGGMNLCLFYFVLILPFIPLLNHVVSHRFERAASRSVEDSRHPASIRVSTGSRYRMRGPGSAIAGMASVVVSPWTGTGTPIYSSYSVITAAYGNRQIVYRQARGLDCRIFAEAGAYRQGQASHWAILSRPFVICSVEVAKLRRTLLSQPKGAPGTSATFAWSRRAFAKSMLAEIFAPPMVLP